MPLSSGVSLQLSGRLETFLSVKHDPFVLALSCITQTLAREVFQLRNIGIAHKNNHGCSDIYTEKTLSLCRIWQ
jgi:hypothetical protein